MGAITTAILAATAVAGTVMQGQQQKKSAEAQARTLDAEAKNAELENAEAAKRERIKAERTISRIRARLSNQGTDTTQGTPLQLLGEASANIELGFQDAARRSQMEVNSIRHSASNARFAGRQASTSAYITAAGSALSGAAKAGGQYADDVYKGKRPDIFGIYSPRDSTQSP